MVSIIFVSTMINYCVEVILILLRQIWAIYQINILIRHLAK